MTPKRLYLHGLPGANSELAALGFDALAHNVFPIARLRFLDRAASYDSYLDNLADWIKQTWPAAPIHLIGFSMGAMTALRLMERLDGQLAQVDLISPAAPLETGGHLESMAGKAVFKAAMQHRLVISALSHVQRHMPRALFFKLLFANATGQDRRLVSDTAFKRQIAVAMKQCLQDHRTAYVKETLEYVRPWADQIRVAQVPVTLWHGTEDSWAPPAMSDVIAGLLGGQALVRKCDSHAHFSTLQHALTTICDRR